MTHPSILYELNIDCSTGQWGVDCPLDQKLIGPLDYGWDRYQKDPESMTFGGGLLAGSPLPGTRRMIFTGYSPQWEGFYASALGGAMYVFHRVGVNFVWLRGAAKQESILSIRLKNGEYDVHLDVVEPDAIWTGYQDANGKTWQGFYAMQRYVFDHYRNQYDEDNFRILAVGPGSRHTNWGAIGSNPVKKGDLSVIDDWAGRGGLGSRLLQHHHIAAIVFGGDWQDPALKEARELDEYFIAHFGQRTMISDLALSQKYRYVPEFDTGGTFGVNMHTANDRLFSNNYRSIYETSSRRLEQHQNFILNHYLKQFNEEIIQPKSFDHCGEPCAIACKKFVGEFKKDYEPYEALGPNCGIFDQRAAEMINKYVDGMGLDSIQTGGTVAWIMELIYEELIPAIDFGLPMERPRFQFSCRPDEFDVVTDSAYNAEYALAVVNMMLFQPQGALFRDGMREASKRLDQRYGIRSIDRAVYVPHGKTGCMVPNQYWVPGMFSPMPLMGKYFSYYEGKFMPPRKLGRKNVERMVYEFYSENTGSCRFHRKWVEDIIDEIMSSHFELDLDFWNDNFKLAKSIQDRHADASVFWEGERVVDIVHGFLEKWKEDGLKDPELLAWCDRFEADKWEAARAYWDEMKAGMEEAFAGGLAEPLHEEHGFIEKK